MVKKKITTGAVFYENGCKISMRKKVIHTGDGVGVLQDGRVVRKKGERWIYSPS